MKRLFLTLLLLAGGCVDFDALKKRCAEFDVTEKVGVLAHLEITWPDSTKALKRALAYYRSEEVDAVIILGHPGLNGYKNQKEVFEAAWHEAFRGSREPSLVYAADPHEYAGIRFTGAGKLALTDGICVYPKDAKTVNAGSMHGIEVSTLFVRQDEKTVKRYAASAQGLLVLRRTAGMTVKRLDFSEAFAVQGRPLDRKAAAEVGPPWEVDADGIIHTAEGKAPPQFWDDVAISATRGYNSSGQPIYTLMWPPVLARHTGERAFSYDVSVGSRVICHVQGPRFHLPESEETGAILCRVPESALEGEEPRFGVTPVSSLGLAGRTAWSR